jgi:hypothetical protein
MRRSTSLSLSLACLIGLASEPVHADREWRAAGDDAVVWVEEGDVGIVALPAPRPNARRQP